MVASGSKHVLVEALSSMKISLESAYEFKTRVDEEKRLLECLGEKYRGYRVFSDYRRNEGRRRFNEISEFISDAVDSLECCDSQKYRTIVNCKTHGSHFPLLLSERGRLLYQEKTNLSNLIE